MICNLGNWERTIRIILGVTLLVLGYGTNIPIWGTVILYVLGIVALITGIVGFCPAWKAFGINTCLPRTAEKK